MTPFDRPRPGWPPGLLQDDDKKLSKWLASRPDSMLHAREAAAAIEKPMITDTPTLEALRQCRNALAYYRDECTGAEPSASVFARMVDGAIAAADAALSVQAEPFAYWAQSDLGRVFSDGPGGMGLQWHPLYATPQPPAPVPAVPMSDEERASRHRAAFPWLE